MSTVLHENDTDAEFAGIVDELTRRGFLGGAGAAAALLGLAACGSTVPRSTGTAGTGFPVTVQDAFGSVTIPDRPKTVVSAGRTDHDVLLALGVVPKALYRFVPTMTKGVGPWALPRLGRATPTILTNPLNFEKIAALGPDLILDVQSFADRQQYDTLTAIAPTVGLPKGATPNAVPWQQSTEFIATALGRKADGQALVKKTNDYLAARAAANPTFAGKTVTVLLTYGTNVGVYTAGDSRMQILTALGFHPAQFVTSQSSKTFFTQLSPERLSDIRSDVVVVLSQTGQSQSQQLAAFPTLATIPGYHDGHVTFVPDLDVALALSGASVLSIPYAVHTLEPLLQKAVR